VPGVDDWGWEMFHSYNDFMSASIAEGLPRANQIDAWRLFRSEWFLRKKAENINKIERFRCGTPPAC